MDPERSNSFLHDPLQVECTVRLAIDVIKGRWKPSILYSLKDGPRRFSEIHSQLAGASAQALTAQLKQLEKDGIVSRTVIADAPVRVEYRITEFGMTLACIMDSLDDWGRAFLERATKQDAHPEE